MGVGFPIIVVIVIVLAILLARRRDPVERARVLRRTGFTAMAMTTAVFGLFLVGETVADPGGWAAVGWIASWATPLAALAGVAVYRPGPATRLFAVLLGAVVGVSIWFAVDPQGWRALEDRHGPIRAVVSFVLAAAIALLGVKRTAVAGVMLIVLGIVPVLVSGPSSHLGFTSLAVVSSAPFIAGILYLWSAIEARGSPPPASTPSPDESPSRAP